jgi:hypothetical protein
VKCGLKCYIPDLTLLPFGMINVQVLALWKWHWTHCAPVYTHSAASGWLVWWQFISPDLTGGNCTTGACSIYGHPVTSSTIITVHWRSKGKGGGGGGEETTHSTCACSCEWWELRVSMVQYVHSTSYQKLSSSLLIDLLHGLDATIAFVLCCGQFSKGYV